MAVTVWFFLRPRLGELHPVSLAKVGDFFMRGGILPADEEGFVRYVEVSVLLEDRQAVEVLRVGYFQRKGHADATLDRDYYMKVRSAAGAASFGQSPSSEPPPGVVGAEQKFAKRRLKHLSHWKPAETESRGWPSQRQERALASAKKAKRYQLGRQGCGDRPHVRPRQNQYVTAIAGPDVGVEFQAVEAFRGLRRSSRRRCR
jgi:hypothetical protein